jgi:hypothetical protein
MRFVKSVFLLAGVSGVLLVVPAFFLERWAADFDPPAVNHPEYFYGFAAVVLVYQLFYLLIATDPVRYRPVMLLGALGKASFAAAVVALYLAGRVAPLWLGFVAFDATWVVLFLVAYARTPGYQAPSVLAARDTTNFGENHAGQGQPAREAGAY